MYKRLILKYFLLLIIPPMTSYIIYLLWELPFFFVTAVLYFVLLLFSIPSEEGTFSTFANYKIKQENPHYKIEHKVSEKKINIIQIIAIGILLIVYMLLYIGKIS